jgi:membrane protein CcdC involved in cytochrome C biogenesis
MNNYLKRFLQFVVIFILAEAVNITLRYYRTDEWDFSVHNWIGWILLAVIFFGMEIYQTYKKKTKQRLN